MQPDSPAQLGGKIYEMMGMALSGKWAATPTGGFQQRETLEAEVVEPAEVGSHKWWRRHFFVKISREDVILVKLCCQRSFGFLAKQQIQHRELVHHAFVIILLLWHELGSVEGIVFWFVFHSRISILSVSLLVGVHFESREDLNSYLRPVIFSEQVY